MDIDGKYGNMDLEEADKSPAEQWQSSLNATCNRLTNQYLQLVRSASSKVELDMTTGGMDPRGTYVRMYVRYMN